MVAVDIEQGFLNFLSRAPLDTNPYNLHTLVVHVVASLDKALYVMIISAW